MPTITEGMDRAGEKPDWENRVYGKREEWLEKESESQEGMSWWSGGLRKTWVPQCFKMVPLGLFVHRGELWFVATEEERMRLRNKEVTETNFSFYDELCLRCPDNFKNIKLLGSVAQGHSHEIRFLFPVLSLLIWDFSKQQSGTRLKFMQIYFSGGFWTRAARAI